MLTTSPADVRAFLTAFCCLSAEVEVMSRYDRRGGIAHHAVCKQCSSCGSCMGL